jgi:hypothetical protein
MEIALAMQSTVAVNARHFAQPFLTEYWGVAGVVVAVHCNGTLHGQGLTHRPGFT